MSQLIVGPFNRVEGDLEVRLAVDEGRVSAAHVNAPLYRGFEVMLLGKDPRDALTITPRICGICSISQSAAAAFALAGVAGVKPAPMGAQVAALLHAAENTADHLTHFNLFFMPDFARQDYADRDWHARAVDRFTAAQGGAVRRSVEARTQLFHIIGTLGGKWPHTLAIQPGGVTRTPSASEKVRMAATLRGFRRYLEEVVFGAPLEDFVALDSVEALRGWSTGDAGLFFEIAEDLGLADIGRGTGRHMSFGAYPLEDGPAIAPGVFDSGLAPVDPARIIEDLSHAWMRGEAAHPAAGMTVPGEDMADPGYSWCKAPRYAGQTIEVGALARQIVDGHPLARDMVGGGVMGRVAGRLLEIARLQGIMEHWVDTLDVNARFMDRVTIPREGTGVGLVEAARGSLGHWIRVEKGVIAGYQIIAPTTWNFSPRDAGGGPGPLEAALVGTPVREGEVSPVMVQHVVRSFDPCMVCTVH
ncbi:nickel-dependent hydrogenase large subunit [uncultured Maritimibacter sp.]|jgi:hydrogenase large subunit|uniref:nickel-dependent hydrogenase large subunit n=1 Tax=uncultured Maritimibacter sp. TaxID=991866 RepID=UPI000A3DF253|nr:nickel-dependent hydrogenase large subunit [uncultured Maritimibacter sp.]